MLTGIIATARGGLIGNAGQLPWLAPADLIRFKTLTWDKSVLMGRRTFESLGRWLPHRRHLILTRDPNYQPPFGPPPENSSGMVIGEAYLPLLIAAKTEVFVVGGAEVYEKLWPHLKMLHWTLIPGTWEGDTRVNVPFLEDPSWHVTAQEEHPSGLIFATLTR